MLIAANNRDFFQRLSDFFDSGTWTVVRDALILVVAVFWLAIAYWIYKDARRRIESSWLVALATVLGLVLPFVGVIIYLLFRPPEYLDEIRERELEIRAMEETLALQEMRCPVCRAQVDPSFLVCPVCTTRLRQACDSCKAPLEPLWQICPYCETPIESPRSLDLDATQSLEAERRRRGERASG